MKCPNRMEHRVVRLKFRVHHRSQASQTLSLLHLLPGVTDLISEISSSLSPCTTCLLEYPTTYPLTSSELRELAGPSRGETAKVSVGATTLCVI